MTDPKCPAPAEVEKAVERCLVDLECAVEDTGIVEVFIWDLRTLLASRDALQARVGELEAEVEEKCEDCHHKTDFEQHLFGCGIERDRVIRAGLVDDCDEGGGLWRNARAEAAEARLAAAAEVILHGDSASIPEGSLLDCEVLHDIADLYSAREIAEADAARLRGALGGLYELNATGVFSVPDKHYGAITNAATALAGGAK